MATLYKWVGRSTGSNWPVIDEPFRILYTWPQSAPCPTRATTLVSFPKDMNKKPLTYTMEKLTSSGFYPERDASDLKDGIYGLDPLPPKVIPLSDLVVKPRSRREEFEQARKTGAILLRPLEKFESSATLIAGAPLHLPPPAGNPVRIAMSSSLASGPWGPETPRYIECMRDDRFLYTHMAGFKLDEPLYLNRRQGFTFNCYYYAMEVDRLEYPPEYVVRHFERAILEALKNREWSTSLITSGLAEANSGIFDLLTELAESKESISYLFGLLKQILTTSRKVARDIKRRKNVRNTDAGLDTLDEIASAWMQYRYAIGPLIHSANDHLEYITKGFNHYQTVRKGEEWTIELDDFDGWGIEPIKVVDRFFGKYRFQSDKMHNLKFNPLSTAWEIYPLSFVVGWALNVGDLLSSLVKPGNVTDEGFTYSRQLKSNSLLVAHRTNFMAGSAVINGRYYKTTPFDPLGRVGLTFEWSMSDKRWLDALALSWSLFASKITRDILRP